LFGLARILKCIPWQHVTLSEKGRMHMLMSTVVAVALGIAPVNHDGSVAVASKDYSGEVGHYTQVVDRRGTTHVRGRDGRGRPYELIVSKSGYVEASVGERDISFRVEESI
jgi:hypothetical protein